MTELYSPERLAAVPLRALVALVALVARCARRVQPLWGDLEPERQAQLERAVEIAVVCDDVVISILPEVPYPDAVAELVDLLVRLEGALWAVCIAPCGPSLQVSVRSNDRDARAGEMLACLLPPGTEGGHGMV